MKYYIELRGGPEACKIVLTSDKLIKAVQGAYYYMNNGKKQITLTQFPKMAKLYKVAERLPNKLILEYIGE